MRTDKLLYSDGVLVDVTIMFELEITLTCEAHCCAPTRRPTSYFTPRSDDPDEPGFLQCTRCRKSHDEHLARGACSDPQVIGGIEAHFIIGITDSETVVVRNARDPRRAPWRYADMFLPIAITAGGLRVATPHTETEEKDHG